MSSHTQLRLMFFWLVLFISNFQVNFNATLAIIARRVLFVEDKMVDV